MTECRYVLMLFGGNVVAYNAAAALQQSSFRPVCLIPKNEQGLFRFSRWLSSARLSSYAVDDDGYCDELVAFIRSLNSPKPILVFLTNDQAIYFWIKHCSSLSPYCTIQDKHVEQYYYKDAFAETLTDLGVAHPETWKLQEQPLYMPCLVKPSYKDLDNLFIKQGKSKIRIVTNIDDYERLQKTAQSELLCQEIVDYEEGDEFSWWGYRNARGEICSVVAQHLKKYPDKAGRIAHARLVKNAEIQRIGDNIAQRTGYVGIADIQMIHNRKTGMYTVIEMNPRLWCSHELLLMNGINFVRLCVEEYYQTATDQTKAECLGGLIQGPSREWFSILYNLLSGSRLGLKHTEFYGLRAENLRTRIMIFVFLAVKLFYYSLFRRKKDF